MTQECDLLCTAKPVFVHTVVYSTDMSCLKLRCTWQPKHETHEDRHMCSRITRMRLPHEMSPSRRCLGSMCRAAAYAAAGHLETLLHALWSIGVSPTRTYHCACSVSAMEKRQSLIHSSLTLAHVGMALMYRPSGHHHDRWRQPEMRLGGKVPPQPGHQNGSTTRSGGG